MIIERMVRYEAKKEEQKIEKKSEHVGDKEDSGDGKWKEVEVKGRTRGKR